MVDHRPVQRYQGAFRSPIRQVVGGDLTRHAGRFDKRDTAPELAHLGNTAAPDQFGAIGQAQNHPVPQTRPGAQFQKVIRASALDDRPVTLFSDSGSLKPCELRIQPIVLKSPNGSKGKKLALNLTLVLAEEINHAAAADNLPALECDQDLFRKVELDAVA